MRIENWSLSRHLFSPYNAPEVATHHLMGIVYGHPVYGDGKLLQTSPIKKIENGLVVTRSGGVYELGKVAPDYEAQFPGARARLLMSSPA